jgi:predicted RNA-binding protein with PIN domain
MHYLIDGYNLLHTLGAMRPHMGPAGMEHARRHLLALLAGTYGSDAGNVTVVFDAAHPPPGAAHQQQYHGVHVCFAVAQHEADELIEQLIRRASAPKQLTVVSNDHRIQQAARHRRCVVLGCDAYLNELERHRPHATTPPEDPAAKPQGVSPADTEHWLREFADLANDPQAKEALKPFDFEEPTR